MRQKNKIKKPFLSGVTAAFRVFYLAYFDGRRRHIFLYLTASWIYIFGLAVLLSI